MLDNNAFSHRMKVKYGVLFDFVSFMSRKLFERLFSLWKDLASYKHFLCLDKNEKLSELPPTTADSQ